MSVNTWKSRKMHVKVLIFLGLAALAAAGSSEEYIYRRPQRHSEESDESYESGEAQYAFDWAVRHESSENDFGHQESRDGDETQGSYYVRLPDTRLQRVTYRVEGDSGYVADVSYEGEAQFPDSYESRESDESYEAYRRYYSSGSNESK